MQALAVEDGMETIRQAIAEAKRAYNVQKIGITGYCMGGTFALRAACEISELAAAAPFYGDIPEENVLKKLKVPTLFIAGKRDAWINPEKVNQLIEAARKYDLPVEVVSYDADHAFFNDTRPEVYDPEAAADAWRRVLGLFGKKTLSILLRRPKLECVGKNWQKSWLPLLRKAFSDSTDYVTGSTLCSDDVSTAGSRGPTSTYDSSRLTHPRIPLLVSQRLDPEVSHQRQTSSERAGS